MDGDAVALVDDEFFTSIEEVAYFVGEVGGPLVWDCGDSVCGWLWGVSVSGRFLPVCR
jgi:hypothetical protein